MARSFGTITAVINVSLGWRVWLLTRNCHISFSMQWCSLHPVEIPLWYCHHQTWCLHLSLGPRPGVWMHPRGIEIPSHYQHWPPHVDFLIIFLTILNWLVLPCPALSTLCSYPALTCVIPSGWLYRSQRGLAFLCLSFIWSFANGQLTQLGALMHLKQRFCSHSSLSELQRNGMGLHFWVWG